ncbi:LuxR family transcriptional regulator [Rhodococcus sp. ABRD24]|uniref:LuxR C-terminal-related transcriptional regulator n=1 Tax=Rhodococcus sp. ABRD24 TaxID=2507582 RepID=UPI001039BE27|nr:LuxR C-terminal-related transcriptional regulator [Rhodococcus sp. ABRD24]QBJ97756.1 LuxR family transcriptional regulator [Rhodococcus sp. ABRD24]
MGTYQAGSARERVGALSRAGLAWADFGEQALEVLTTAVPFDSACFGTIDPATALVTGSVKTGLPEPCEVEFMHHEYVEDDVSLFVDLAKRAVGVSILHDETGGDPRRSSRFRDLFEPRFGLGHELRLMLRCGDQTWGGLAIYRSAGSSGFSPAEADFLDGLSTTLAVGIRAGLVAAAGGSLDLSRDTAGPAVMLFDGAGEVVQATAAAERQVSELGGDLWGQLPPSIVSIVSAARALASGRTGAVPRLRVRSRSGEWLTIHAAPMAGHGDGSMQIAVTVEKAGPPDVLPLIVSALGLTGRERDVVAHVLHGATTAEIAKRLYLSPYTVQDHLKSVFEKAGVSSRRELTSRVFFDQYAPRIGETVTPSGWFAEATLGVVV